MKDTSEDRAFTPMLVLAVIMLSVIVVYVIIGTPGGLSGSTYEGEHLSVKWVFTTTDVDRTSDSVDVVKFYDTDGKRVALYDVDGKYSEEPIEDCNCTVVAVAQNGTELERAVPGEGGDGE
jgi:hypothetical protein